MAGERTAIDWPAVRRDFEAGSMTNVALADWYSVSEGAIRKRAKSEGWVRGGTTVVPDGQTVATPETTSSAVIVGRGRNLTLRMLDELEAQTSRLGELETIIDMAVDTGDGGKQREALQQALSLKQRAEVLKSLALAAKTLADTGAPAGKKAERQATAERVAQTGRFAPPSAPKLAVDNTR